MKKQRLMMGLLAAIGMSSTFASTSSEYNIANGLSPIEKDQSISVLQPFQGNFRILGSKVYQNDEQAKFSP
ncbi:hypothetical protein ACSLGU_19960, partial [Acinetobacter sp. A11]